MKRDKKESIEQKIIARREQREKFEEESRVRFKEVKKAKPKYKEIEEKFQNDYEAPTLEERKKHLQELRDFKRPIDRHAINTHE